MALSAPVEKDGFFFSGDLFVEAAGHNRHRRATITELKQHFESGSEKDHPAHWFEAQCIHYGLKPSKTKAVARMRLFDASKADELCVPRNIQKLEAELKKEWTKNERAAKQSLSASQQGTSSSKRASSKKRPISPLASSANSPASTKPASKKVKAEKIKPEDKSTANTKPAPSPKSKSTSKATEAKAKPPKSTTKAAATAKPPPVSTSASAAPRPKQTARRGGSSISVGRTATSVPAPAAPSRPKQTARRGGAFAARGRAPLVPVPRDAYYPDEPPPYSAIAEEDHSGGYSESESIDSDSRSAEDSHRELRPLGLLNGMWEVECPYIEQEWPQISRGGFHFVLTLQGERIWASFDLGVFTGVMLLEDRPYAPSYEPLEFSWRGIDTGEGEMQFGHHCHGEMSFLGGGVIEGMFAGPMLGSNGVSFSAKRTSGNETRSPIDAATMRNEWDGYNREAYDEANRRRWG